MPTCVFCERDYSDARSTAKETLAYCSEECEKSDFGQYFVDVTPELLEFYLKPVKISFVGPDFKFEE